MSTAHTIYICVLQQLRKKVSCWFFFQTFKKNIPHALKFGFKPFFCIVSFWVTSSLSAGSNDEHIPFRVVLFCVTIITFLQKKSVFFNWNKRILKCLRFTTYIIPISAKTTFLRKILSYTSWKRTFWDYNFNVPNYIYMYIILIYS